MQKVSCEYRAEGDGWPRKNTGIPFENFTPTLLHCEYKYKWKYKYKYKHKCWVLSVSVLSLTAFIISICAPLEFWYESLFLFFSFCEMQNYGTLPAVAPIKGLNQGLLLWSAVNVFKHQLEPFPTMPRKCQWRGCRKGVFTCSVCTGQYFWQNFGHYILRALSWAPILFQFSNSQCLWAGSAGRVYAVFTCVHQVVVY